MTNFSEFSAAADRLKAASNSLSDPKDLEIVKAYLHELEQKAQQTPASRAIFQFGPLGGLTETGKSD